MIDAHFYGKPRALSLRDIVAFLQQRTLWASDAIPQDTSPVFSGFSNLKDATASHMTYYAAPKQGGPDYKSDLEKTQAGLVLVAPEHQGDVPPHTQALCVTSPYRAYAELVRYAYTDAVFDNALGSIHTSASIHPTAVVAPTAIIESDVVIGPLCVVGARAHIQKGVRLASHAHLGSGVVVGEGTVIEPHVTIQYAYIGRGVYIKTGARIGQDGFGFDMDHLGPIDMPQMGVVRLLDHVKIGSNTCIDRATLNETRIETGVRIDNLVQIAHNVQVGAYSVLVAQVGIAGSTTLGQGVIVGGQVGISGHIHITDGVRIAAQSGVMRSIPHKMDVAGSPSMPARDWHKQTVFLKNESQKKKKS